MNNKQQHILCNEIVALLREAPEAGSAKEIFDHLRQFSHRKTLKLAMVTAALSSLMRSKRVVTIASQPVMKFSVRPEDKVKHETAMEPQEDLSKPAQPPQSTSVSASPRR